MDGHVVSILLVEDDEVDAEAITRAFRRQKIGNPITIVSDGIEALNVLRGQNGYAKLPQPYLTQVVTLKRFVIVK